MAGQIATTIECELAAGRAPRIYRVVLIRAGEWLGKGLWAPPDALAAAADKFEGAPSFLNPPARQPGQHGHPGLERLLGVVENARWDAAANGIVADYRLLDGAAAGWFAALIDDWLAARDAGRRVPAVGLSAVLTVSAGPVREDGLREVLEVIKVEQVDAVHKPAAGGEFVRVINAEWDADRTDLTDAPDPLKEDQAHQLDQSNLRPILTSLRQTLLDARLAASGLPAGWQQVVAAGLPERWEVADLDAGIARVRAAWAEDQSRHTVQGVRPLDGATAAGGATITHGTAVTHMLDSRDQLGEALHALIEGRSPRGGIRPLAGIREAYLLLSGDYEMTGLFRPERVALANVNSTTMAGLLADALNKVVVSEFQSYPRWWEPITRREAFSSLQTVKWVKLGGVGELPEVEEGAAYTELTWADATESAAWQKRGGYLGLTLEAMDKDDVGRLRKAPAALAQAAWLTLGKAVANIFTEASGAGPTMSDGKALFHADHGNLGSAALSSAAWSAARLAMRKQTELGSGTRLGALTSPKYLLVPPDLEATALLTLGGEGLPQTDGVVNAAGADFEARLNAAARRVITVDLWTDSKDWAAVADPRLCPAVGIGYRYGETPEIFSVASPTSGLMFTNDVMPVKVRWFFAAGAMDWRGVYKANVA